MLRETLAASLESIKRQHTSFFKDLTECVAKIRQDGTYTTESIKKSHIQQVIKQHTNMTTLFKIEPGYNNAHFMIPVVNTHHIFAPWFFDLINSGRDMVSISEKPLKGSVDIENGRVNGAYSKIEVEICIGVPLLSTKHILPQQIFTDEELAAIIMHELGHAFTYFQYFHSISESALVAQATANQLLGATSIKEREIILKKADEVLGIETDKTDITKLVEYPKPGVEVILLSRSWTAPKIAGYSTNIYDFKQCEQLADTFVVKNGGSVALAGAVDRLNRLYGLYGVQNSFVNVIVRLLELLTAIPMIPVVILTQIAIYDIYDKPVERLKFMRNQTVDGLKTLTPNQKKERAQIVSEIEAIDKLIAEVKYREPLIIKIIDTFSFQGRFIKNQHDKQKELEAMLYNDLFYKSAKLKQLK